ncbi:MFS transporter [Catenulispora subtropica]|uniref:MFS transporter n=1 Tax=Catenulispora subtropica TaxID=450798 RepID=A0ABN2T7H1_9ACTN
MVGTGSGLNAYLRLLRSPGAGALALSGVVGRFPIAMRSIACLMLISAVTGSLGDAGAVAAAMLVAQGVVSPVYGRLADRHSQRRVLLAACGAHAVTMAALITAIELRAPLWVTAGAAVATGCSSVSFSSFMRARWAAFAEAGALRTAYALESMLDETIYLLGPLLVTVLITEVHPSAGLVACAVLTTGGSVAVALHRRSEPFRSDPETGPRGPERAIAVSGVRVLTLAYAGMGFLLGAVEVTMIAFARERSAPALGGVFVSLTAVGSLAAGLVFGAVDWKLSQARLLIAGTFLLTAGVVPLVFAPDFPVMGVLAVVAGIAISPALIAGSTLLEAVAPKASLSEAFSWLTSAGAIGIASGTAVGGRLADHGGFGRAAWAAVGGGIVALLVVAAGQPALAAREPARAQDRKPAQGTEEPPEQVQSAALDQ